MKVKVIPDSYCLTTPEFDDEGNALIEQSNYDHYKTWMNGILDDCLGKNVAYQRFHSEIAFVFREDFTIQIIKSEHPMAKSEADWAEYFIGECGFAESIRRG